MFGKSIEEENLCSDDLSLFLTDENSRKKQNNNNNKMIISMF
jgi:hypothetical protein